MADSGISVHPLKRTTSTGYNTGQAPVIPAQTHICWSDVEGSDDEIIEEELDEGKREGDDDIENEVCNSFISLALV